MINKLLLIIFISFFLGESVLSKGDLAIRSKKIELKLGSDKSDYAMSQKVFELETGKAYRLEISSMGFKEYEFEAEEFFKNIWIRKIEIEFEREGEIEINFVPIRTGEFSFEIERLQEKGMIGKFIVK